MEDDIPLLNTPNLVALILRQAEAGGATAEACAGRLAALWGKPGDMPPVDRNEVIARCATHIRWLRAAGLLAPDDGRWVLTEDGRVALGEHPEGMDVAELAGFAGFADWLERHDGAERRSGIDPRSTAYDEGFAARDSGAEFTDNPYDFATADHQMWEKGWCEALDEEAGPGLSPVTGSQRDTN